MKHFLLAAALILSAPAVMACETVTIGDLTIEHAWSKATIGAGRPGDGARGGAAVLGRALRGVVEGTREPRDAAIP